MHSSSYQLSGLLNSHLSLSKSNSKKEDLFTAIINSERTLSEIGISDQNIIRVLEFSFLDKKVSESSFNKYLQKAAKTLSKSNSKYLARLRYIIDQKLLTKHWSP